MGLVKSAIGIGSLLQRGIGIPSRCLPPTVEGGRQGHLRAQTEGRLKFVSCPTWPHAST
ncbi:MAG: hypothetical protein ACLULM_04785 [Acutalibacter sp.]